LNAPESFIPKLPIAEKITTNLANGVRLVKTNRATRELGLVVMSVGIFYRVSLHSSVVENKFVKSVVSESERE